jgi:response regulator RpfG family c-di-GMP phosphodiesterase
MSAELQNALQAGAGNHVNETQSDTPAEQPATLLFVDDEANILSALKRLFRPHGYRIFTAGGGAEGLEIMARESVDLVVSDMRMPEMNGAQFLEQVRLNWPETVRILLTGYAEIGATIDAINKGQIYRYISKPWEDNDIVIAVQHALERKLLQREKQRLELLTKKQNEELRELNESLEDKVKARTEEVRQTMGFLEVAHEKLKKSFITSVTVFANLIELREGAMAGHSRRVANDARKLAKRLGMNDNEAQDVMLAALLHDIGKMGLPDRLLQKPFSQLTSEERVEVVKHPAKGQAALMALEQLHPAAALIRAHHERFDGMGFPDGIAGSAIPAGARILAVVNDYDALQSGALLAKSLKPAEALEFLLESRGKRYDPAVVDAYIAMLGGGQAAAPTGPELALKSPQLQPGMALSRDLVTRDGVMLLAKDYLLDEGLIQQIRSFEKSDGSVLTIYINAKRG